MKESALKRQEGGSHYNLPIQPIQYITANGLGFIEGNIIKYATRHDKKGGAEDVAKIIHYAELLLELKYKPCDACQPAATPEPTVTGSTKWPGIMDRLGLQTERNTLGDLLKGCLQGGLEAEADELRALPSRVPGITNSINLGAFLELMEEGDGTEVPAD